VAERTVLVLGGGVGGVVVANVLRRELAPEDRVVLIERARHHTFGPSLLWLMSGSRKTEQVQRDLGPLARRGIEVRQGAVQEIDPERRRVVVDGETLTGDAVVVSLGAALAPERVPGLPEAGGNFYTVQGAQEVRDRVSSLSGGREAVVVADVPFKCPAAPYEAAMLLEHVLRRRRVRDRTTVSVYAAEPAPMGVAGPAVSQGIVAFLRERGIEYFPNYRLAEVDVAARRLRFQNGEVAEFDVLAVVPPHEAPPVVRRSPLAGPDGWVPIDPVTCETRFPNVFAIGDVTVVPLKFGKPLPKAGVFAHGQAEAVARTVVARLRGRGHEQRFDGHGECFVEMGGGIAAFARGNFYADPVPQVQLHQPGRRWHAAKVAFERTWWHTWF
jgi:sulfide:quinone oxidoreductase